MALAITPPGELETFRFLERLQPRFETALWLEPCRAAECHNTYMVDTSNGISLEKNIIRKYTQEDKIKYIEEYKRSNLPRQTFSKAQGISPGTFRDWCELYKRFGKEAFIEQKDRRFYDYETKIQAVQAYLNGEGSLREISWKLGIKSTKQLRTWLIQYNNDKNLRATPVRKKVITVSKKTTLEERIRIVEYCILKNHSYSEASEKFNVSYQQVRMWVIKAKGVGYSALVDDRGRGRSKEKKTELTELEKLRLENRELKAKLEQHDAIEAFEKKFNEIQHKG